MARGSKQVRFRRYLFRGIFAATMVPIGLLSMILVYQLNQHFQNQIETSITSRLDLFDTQIGSEVELILSNLDQISTDQNVILVPKNAVFSVRVNQRLNDYLSTAKAVRMIQVYDTTFWPSETVPSSYQFFESPVLLDFLAEVTDQDENLNAFQYLQIEEIHNFNGADPGELGKKSASSSYLVYAIKLNQYNELNPDKAIYNGMLVGLISIQDLLISLELQSFETVSISTEVVEISPKGYVEERAGDWLFGTKNINLSGEKFVLKYGIDRAKAMKSRDTTLGTVGLFVFLIAVLVFSIVYILTDRIAMPIKNLAELVKSYGYQDGQIQSPKSSIYELTELGDGLSKMSHVIQEGRLNLEEKVETRTVELATTNERLQETLTQMESMQGQMVQQEKMALLGQLVAGVAHEINTPLGVALTANSSLYDESRAIDKIFKEGNLNQTDFTKFMDHCLESMDLAQRNLRRAAELVQNFKLVSADQSHGERRSFYLKEYLEGLVETLWPEIKRVNPQIEFKIEESLEVNSFPGVFAHIFTNLILNSVIHGFGGNNPESSTASNPESSIANKINKITILSERNEFGLVLNYFDNGKGMTDEIKQRIFDPFFTTKRGDGGTGLGMHIVYNQITQQLGGQISVSDNDLTGIHLQISLPDAVI